MYNIVEQSSLDKVWHLHFSAQLKVDWSLCEIQFPDKTKSCLQPEIVEPDLSQTL